MIDASLHIAPVGFEPGDNCLNLFGNIVFSTNIAMLLFVIGSNPIPALTCSDTPELGLPSTHSYGYGSQSSPALSHIWPASSLAILVQYAG